MKDLSVLLEGVAEGLKALSKGIESVAGQIEDLVAVQEEKKEAKPAKKAAPAKKKSAAVKKRKPATAADTVLEIIKRSRKGVGIAAIKKKTGYNDKKIHNIVYKLKKLDKIQNVSKGIYIKK